MKRLFVVAMVLVLLCAAPAVFADIIVGKTMGLRVPACDTEEAARDIASQKTEQDMGMRYSVYNSIRVNGDPLCGVMTVEVTIVGVNAVYTIGDTTITVFTFIPTGTTEVYYGLTTLKVIDGKSI